MKKTVVMISLMLVSMAVPVLGEVHGGPSGAGATAQQKSAASDSKKSEESKESMTSLMRQMNAIMQKMTSTFENKAGQEGRNKAVLGKMMREMSRQMSDMAAVIEKGRIDQQTLINMQARMESVSQRIDAIQ